MLRPTHLAGVNGIDELARIVEASGWGSPASSTERYDPADLANMIAVIQSRCNGQRIWQMPNTSAMIDALNARLRTPISRRENGSVDANRLPVAVIYWLAVTGLNRLAL